MFSRIAIVNRGEAAMRLIHAVREMNARTGSQVVTIALHTDGERAAMFAREADESYPLGPAADRPYLDHTVLERALRETKAEAAWVGWGFVAEDPAFADLCARLGVTFVGPSGQAMRDLGDKIGAKLIAERAGVPVAPWSGGAVQDVAQATAQARAIGYPLMLKAAAGGGGRGIRVVTSDEDLSAVFDRTAEEAQRAFGNGTLFLERLITGARHVEVQLIADGDGAWALGVRDCSVQRRNQKLLEESTSPVLPEARSRELKASAERLAVAVGYRGAATVEFLYHPGEDTLAFLEVNTRLQVEHPVTELTTGADLVALQLHVAAGGALDGPRPVESGHAIEARLNAEDPDRDFAPAPGRIARLRLPTGPGVRVDTGVAEGDTIPPDFDSMIAKIIAHGRTREEALGRLQRALEDTTVVVEGGTTNKSFLLDLLAAGPVRDGSADTGWIDRVRTTGGLVNRRHSGVALLAAAIAAYEEEEQAERRNFLVTAQGGRPQARHEVGRPLDLQLRGTAHRVLVAQIGPSRYRMVVDHGSDIASTHDVLLERLDTYNQRLTVAGRTARVVLAAHGVDHQVEVDGVQHRVTRDEGGVMRSPAPALVVATPVAVGQQVAAGAPVVVLESMKMETVVSAPFPARVRELLVSTGGQVGAGAALVRLEPLVEGGPVAAVDSEPLDLPDEDDAESTSPGRCLEDVRSLLLGYDLTPEQARSRLETYRRLRSAPDPLAEEIDVLTAFADLCELTRNKPAEQDSQDERVHSPREFFQAYLASLDVDRERLPEDFRARLGRVLAYYGVHELDRCPPLEEAVYRIFLAQQRVRSHLGLVTSMLQEWLAADPPQDGLTDTARDCLDRLVLATQLRFPVVGDLARSVRFQWFDRPMVEALREQAYAGVRQQLAYLGENPDAADYEQRIDQLTASPEPLVRFLAERIVTGAGPHEPMLEVLARRHYRDHTLTDVRYQRGTSGAGPTVTARYTMDGRHIELFSTVGTVATMERLAPQVEQFLAGVPEGSDAVVDLYLGWPQAPQAHDAAAAELAEQLSELPFAHRVRRIAVAAAGPAGRLLQYTFRPAGRTVAEDELVRGLHPMVARRLDLWRLRDFTITRLPAADDVLLYKCVAPSNPSDQRLVALAQVRELAVVRDAAGRVVSLPQVERLISSCLDSIRRARAAMGSRARLDMNHVFLYVWPVVDAPLEELTSLQRSIAPLTGGAGLTETVVQGRVPVPGRGEVPVAVRFSRQPGSGVQASVGPPPTTRLAPLDDYAQKVLRSRQRGTVYPYELLPQLAREGGSFLEHDLDEAGRLVPVQREPGGNRCGMVVGVATTPTERYPEGIRRVVLLGDPTRALGAVAEPECARVCAALDLAQEQGLPVEWFALSAGARISMDSGTENMDWVARALRRIIGFTQAGGEINVVVAGINVGAQPYWNAEATMLMHTKGILVMTPDSAMVLTGKTSLDYSGGVSAEDNFGIGGYDRVMGPNGQAQYWAPDLGSAVDVLFAHYEHAYRAPGERVPRPAPTSDPRGRDVREYPHQVADSDFTTVGDIFSATRNPERKKAFDIRTVMRAVADADHPVLERWAGMAEAETSVVLDAHLGGYPVALLGIESRQIARRGFPPSDGPDTWTAGTLFPRSSKKTARAINAASGSRPLVVLANLSGFDGSPESMRQLQLEYGAEIGRAVVNFEGPVVFCVVSRYHGGAFVVFSKTLHDNMTVLAVEGSFASVIGGAPAAGVVFTGEVDARTSHDPRVVAVEQQVAAARDGLERARRRTDLAELRAAVRSEKLSEVAAEFDSVHSIQRAVQVGSVDAVIPAAQLRPRLIEAVEAGLARHLEG